MSPTVKPALDIEAKRSTPRGITFNVLAPRPRLEPGTKRNYPKVRAMDERCPCLSGDGAGTSVIARLFGKDDCVRLATV